MEEVSGTPITARAERDRYVAFAFAAADLLLEVDPAGLIAFATGAAKSIADRDVDALIGANFLDIIQDADRGLAKLMLTTLNQRGRLSPVPVRLSDANQSMALLGGCRLPTDVTRHHLTFTILPGIGQAPAIGKRSEQTGLLSKDDFARIAEQWLNRTDGDYRISLLGVGGLDKVREAAGEEMSSGFMKALGRHIQARSVDGDAAGELAAGRFGLIHRGELDERLLQQKISDLAATIDLQDRIVVAKHTLELSAPDLTAADAARTLVYAINSFAKARGEEFTLASLADGFKVLVAETAEKVRDLRGTLAAREFTLAFQPIVTLGNREIHHFEALSRFTGQRARGASPAEVVGFAEQVGVIVEFDLAVCQRVIAALNEFPDADQRPFIAVNFSGRSLESTIFAGEIDALLRAHPLVAPHLLFEITESANIVQMVEVQNFLQSLRGRGFRVCLDDFGAGSASFHYLSAFPVDFVKIDGKYVRNVTGSARLRSFLRAMASLCQDLGTASIAEMVETEAQAAEVAALGVGFGQGYLFGKPAAELRPIAPRGAARKLHPLLTARQVAAGEQRKLLRVTGSD